MITLPFLTSYDPAGTSEGTLDPLGLYQIADQLAVQLVPAVRERMQRIRFLTAMTVGAVVTEGLDFDPQYREATPYLVWEWLVVEAMTRAEREDAALRGVPGKVVARRAIDQLGYLDARSYLKTSRVFGFNGVYKRLAIHLGLVDVHLGPGPNADSLVDAWARDAGLGGREGARVLFAKWSDATSRSLKETPPRTKTRWASEDWEELARLFWPDGMRAREKRYLHDALMSADSRRLGALPELWELQPRFQNDELREEHLLEALQLREPAYGQLLDAIRSYETFARRLQNAFDILRAEAARQDTHGFVLTTIAGDDGFEECVSGLHEHFATAHRALGEVMVSAQNHLGERFGDFGEPMDAVACARTLCSHHETVQRAKSFEGKRPWFDRVGQDRIYVRHAYRVSRPESRLDRYVHGYRGEPIRSFYRDLT